MFGRNQDRNFGENMRNRSKSRHIEKIYHFCKKNGYFRANCRKLKNRNRMVVATTNNGKQLENKR